jgi:hypothetical protein
MADLNVITETAQTICINSSSIPTELQPVAAGMSQILNVLSIFFGGIIGLYILFMFLQWRERAATNKKIKQIQLDLVLIKKKLGIKSVKKKR